MREELPLPRSHRLNLAHERSTGTPVLSDCWWRCASRARQGLTAAVGMERVGQSGWRASRGLLASSKASVGLKGGGVQAYSRWTMLALLVLALCWAVPTATALPLD